jgi:L-asparaginase II
VDDGAADRFGLGADELALCCGSHSGEPRHVRAAESILRKAGVDADSLSCGPHPPFHAATRRDLVEAGLEPGRLHNNCSGKHAGMMLLARAHGWDPRGYERADHPVQERILTEVTRWTDLPAEAIGSATDGCGVICFALPLQNMALAYARLAADARRGSTAAEAVVRAMTEHPEMVAGEGRLCTDLMRCTEGRVFAKLGAEGVYCVGVPGAELGIALKVEDGAGRALAPALLGLLRTLDLISEDDLGVLMRHAFPEVRNTRGEVVGQLRPRLKLLPGDDA